MKPQKISIRFLFFGILIAAVNTQKVYEIDVDLSKPVQKLNEIYQRASNILHWGVLGGSSPPLHVHVPTFRQNPSVLFSNENDRGAYNHDEGMETSASDNQNLAEYVNNILQRTTILPQDEAHFNHYQTLPLRQETDEEGHHFSISAAPANEQSVPQYVDDQHEAGDKHSQKWVSGPPPGWGKPPKAHHGPSWGPPGPPPHKSHSHPHGPSWGPPPPPPHKKPHGYHGPPPSRHPPKGPHHHHHHHHRHPPHKGHHYHHHHGPPPSKVIYHDSPGWGWDEPITVVHKKPSKGWGWGWPKACDPATEPPFSVDNINEVPDGAEIRDGFNMSATKADLPQDFTPMAPSVYKVGGRTKLPQGYDLEFTETYRIRVNADGTTNSEREAVQHGMGAVPSSGQGQGGNNDNNNNGAQSQRTPTPLSTPEPGTVQLTAYAAISPWAAAPLNGSDNPKFMSALSRRDAAFRGAPQSRLTSQMETLLQLFNQVESQMKADEEAEEAKKLLRGHGQGWGWGQEDDEGPVTGGNSDIAAPTTVLQIQRFTVAEPNSSEATMLDAAFNFGIQANRYEFGDVDLIMDTWRGMGSTGLRTPSPSGGGGGGVTASAGAGAGAGGRGREALDTSSLGNSVDGAQSTLNERVRGYLKALRDASAKSYDDIEEKYYGFFDQRQYFIYPPNGCGQPIDPPKSRGIISGGGSIGAPNLNQPAPRCFGPAC